MGECEVTVRWSDVDRVFIADVPIAEVPSIPVLVYRHTRMDAAPMHIIDPDPEVSMTSRYGLFIYWSDDDGAFIAEVPELPGCMAHGNTRESALANAENAIQAWIESAEEFGGPIPRPKGRKLMYA